MTEEQKQKLLLVYKQTLREMEIELDTSEFEQEYERNLLKIPHESREAMRQYYSNTNAFLLETIATWEETLDKIRRRMAAVEQLAAADLNAAVVKAINNDPNL